MRFSGIYSDRDLAPVAGGGVLFGHVAILHDGRLIGSGILPDRSGTSFAGAYPANAGDPAVPVFEGETASVAATGTGGESISGEVLERQSLRLIRSNGERMNDGWVLAWRDVYERPASLPLWEGTWERLEAGASIEALNVDAQGSFFGQARDGCVAAGQLSILEAGRNLYGYTGRLASCGDRDGDYAGFAFLAEAEDGGAAYAYVLAATADGGQFLSHRYVGSVGDAGEEADDSGFGRDVTLEDREDDRSGTGIDALAGGAIAAPFPGPAGEGVDDPLRATQGSPAPSAAAPTGASDLPADAASSETASGSGSFELDRRNSSPSGIAHGGDRFYVVDETDRKVYGYRANGRRDPAADFNLQDRSYPAGISMAGDRLFVVDDFDDTVRAYRMNGERDHDADFELDRENNHNPRGIAFAAGRFHVLDDTHRSERVYAYTSAGERDMAHDFELDAGNASPSGIAYANDRLYVADFVADSVFAYRLNGERDAEADFELGDEAFRPRGIAYADGRFHVVRSFGGAVHAYAGPADTDAVGAAPEFEPGSGPGDPVFPAGSAIAALQLPAASGGDGALAYGLQPHVPGLSFDADAARRELSGTPSVAGAYAMTYTVADADGDTDALAFTIAVDGGDDPEVYDRVAESFALDRGNGSPSGVAYVNGRFHVLDRIDNRVYAYLQTGQPDEAAGFDLDPDNDDPAAIAYGDGRLFVVDLDDDKVYAYTASGQRVAEADFDLDGRFFPVGIARSDSRFYVPSLIHDKVYAYSLSGQRDPQADFDLEEDRFGASAAQIGFANGVLFLVRSDAAKVYAYTEAGEREATGDLYLDAGIDGDDGIVHANGRIYVIDGFRFVVRGHLVSGPAYGFDLDPDNSDPSGIEYANDRFHVLDGSAAKAYAYRADGQRDAAADLDLDADNDRPRGIARAGDRLYVLDGDKVYAYRANGERDAAADFALDLQPDVNPVAIAYAQGRFYVLDRQAHSDGNGNVYAYSSTGERDAAADFELDADNAWPAGIALADGRLYILDWLDQKAYAYGIDGHRDPAADFGVRFFANQGIAFAQGRFFAVGSDGSVTSYAGPAEERGDPGAPSFAPRSGPGDRTYSVRTAIEPILLPAASGGIGALAYALAPDVPGLSFDARTRKLDGTPTGAGRYVMTYTVTDEEGRSDALGFTIAVAAGECYVGLTLPPGESCTYPGTLDAFSVNARGRGAFLGQLAGIRIRIDNETIGGRVYDFEASHQGAGVWRIDRIAGSTEPPETPPETPPGDDAGTDAAVGGFELYPDGINALPSSIVSADGRLYIADESDGNVYAYTADGQRDAAADFDLHPDNANPEGMAYVGGRFHVLDGDDNRVYAYSPAGGRDAAAEFTLHPDNSTPDGIAYANGRFYVVDEVARSVFAYRASGERDPSAGFDLSADNADADGMTFANGRFYVVDDGGGDAGASRVYAYTAAGQRDEAAGFDVRTDRYPNYMGIAYAGGWFYVLDNNYERAYAYSAAGQRDADADLELNVDTNTRPIGIAWANGRFHIADFGERKVYAYSEAGDRDPASDFDIAADQPFPFRAAYVNDRIHVLDFGEHRVYAYSASGERDTSAEFELHADNVYPAGLAFADDLFYVVDWLSERVFAYSASGQRQAWAEFELHPDNRNPAGIAHAGGRLYVADQNPGGVHAYSASGQRDISAEFDLHPDNRAVGGITFANGRFHVLDITTGRVFSYAGASPPDASPSFEAAGNPGSRTYTAGAPIETLTLPEAGGGDGALTYVLSPTVPGLSFDATSRRLTGTPSTPGTYDMTYTATDEDGDADTLGFTITVNADTPAEGSLGVCQVGMTLSPGQSCTYPGTADAFSVNDRGRGSFLGRLAGIRIRIDNETINGRMYDFVASHRGDGVWRIDRVAGSTEPPDASTAGGGGTAPTGGS